jgi:hypothetical protein
MRRAAKGFGGLPIGYRPLLTLGLPVLTAEALNTASHVAVGKPFCRTARRVVACPSRVTTLRHAA